MDNVALNVAFAVCVNAAAVSAVICLLVTALCITISYITFYGK